ncbi:MAG TPA: fumarylacetoacetate hydrolase family protein [Polyangiaceae bacterium]
MRLVTFEIRGNESYGALLDERSLVELSAAFAWHEADQGRSSSRDAVTASYGSNLLDFIRLESRTLPLARAIAHRARQGNLPAVFEGRRLCVALDDVRLLAPLPHPPSLRDGYAFRQHVETARRNRGVPMIPEFDQFPVFYFGNHQAITGPGDVEVEPLQMNQLDFELEVAIVVGKGGRTVSAAQADDHVFGLTIMNDWSARALQLQEMKLNLGPAKGKDFATTLGPWLVTLDEVADRTVRGANGASFDLAMTAEVNGTVISRGNVKDMTFTFAQILERASYGVMLYPGDVIGSGTVGTGCFYELNGSGVTNQWLQPGDRVVLEIERLGRLENRIVLAGRDEPLR